MHAAAEILLSLFVIFVAAQIGAELAQRIRLPGVVGEIVAGCAIGPSALGWIDAGAIASGTPLDVLSEIGVVLLLFAVGLETRLDDLRKVGRSAFLVGVCGVVVPFALGALWAHGAGYAWAKSLFVAAAFVATSAGITARVLQELGALQRIESRVILGAAVIDDILAMLLLGIVTSLQTTGGVKVGALALVMIQAIGFVAIIGWVGTRVMRRTGHLIERPINPLSPLTITLALCLGLAFLSTEFGLAAIIGAFLAGMIASETRKRDELEHQTRPLLAFLTPFFFVITGAKIDIGIFASGAALWMLLVVTVIAVLSKLIGGFLGALSLGRRGAVIVGVGMVPRGEVGIVVASLGLASGVFSNEIYAVIVAMSLLTSIVTPPVLAWLLRRDTNPGESSAPGA
jgi:Kef-type K+ transport system membrane component KefB